MPTRAKVLIEGIPIVFGEVFRNVNGAKLTIGNSPFTLIETFLKGMDEVFFRLRRGIHLENENSLRRGGGKEPLENLEKICRFAIGIDAHRIPLIIGKGQFPLE